MVLVIFRRCENKMKRLLMLCCLVLAGCGEPSGEDQSLDEIIEQVNASGTITDEQAESLSKAWNHYLKGKSSLTDKQNKILEEKRDLNAQWGLLIEEDRVEWLDLCGLTALSDEQAKSLSRLKGLALDGLTTITDDQAESLSKVKGPLSLNGLTSITDQQAKSLAKVDSLEISEACQPLIDKYKKP